MNTKDGFQIWKEQDDIINELHIWEIKATYSPIAQKRKEVLQEKLKELQKTKWKQA